MIGNKKVIGIIPARGGSKGLPGKNIKKLCGKPLVGWTIEKAKLSKYLDKIVLTTDSPEIAEIGQGFGAEVPFLRPAHLAADRSSTFEAVEHALNFFREKDQLFDYIALLEPTSPLRDDDDIDSIIEKLDSASDSFDSIVSLGEIATEHPSIAKKFTGENVTPYYSDIKLTTRRQDNEPAYFPYGIAYVAKVSSYLQEKTFYTDRCTGYLVKRYQNYEIDDIYDFNCIEAIMRHEWGLK